MSTTTKLYYFDWRGLAEIIRITLSATGVEFTEGLLTERQHFTKLIDSGVLPFQQVPLLQIDGLNLVQSGAIARYLARRANIFGSSNEETARIDLLYEGTRDFRSFFGKFCWAPDEEVINDIKDKAFPRYLPAYERILKESGTGFLVGDSLTLADLALFEVLMFVEDYFKLAPLEDYPLLKKYYAALKADSRIEAYLKSPHRKGKATPEKAAELNKVMGRA